MTTLYANNGSSFEIRLIKIKTKDLKKYEDFLSNQIIPDPPEELLIVYEKRVLHEMSYLRAEKYDSPEHQEELRAIQAEMSGSDKSKVPRNIQNPNYNKLLKFYDAIVGSSTLSEAIENIGQLISFLQGFDFWLKKWGGSNGFDYTPGILSKFLDPRCFQKDPEMYFHYLLTKVKHRLQEAEINKFKELVKNKFDDESTEESIFYLKEVRDDKKDYIDLVYQILEALPEKFLEVFVNQYQIEKIKNIDKNDEEIDVDIEYVIASKDIQSNLDNVTNLKQFFDYLYHADT